MRKDNRWGKNSVYCDVGAERYGKTKVCGARKRVECRKRRNSGACEATVRRTTALIFEVQIFERTVDLWP